MGRTEDGQQMLFPQWQESTHYREQLQQLIYGPLAHHTMTIGDLRDRGCISSVIKGDSPPFPASAIVPSVASNKVATSNKVGIRNRWLKKSSLKLLKIVNLWMEIIIAYRECANRIVHTPNEAWQSAISFRSHPMWKLMLQARMVSFTLGTTS